MWLVASVARDGKIFVESFMAASCTVVHRDYTVRMAGSVLIGQSVFLAPPSEILRVMHDTSRSAVEL
jgi:hypothetical protein